MKALSFWKAVTMDKADLLEDVLGLLREHEIRFCLIGGQAVNAYVEPLVSLGLDLAIAVDQIEQARKLIQSRFQTELFPHSLNIFGAWLQPSRPDPDRFQVWRFCGACLCSRGTWPETAGRDTRRRIAGKDLDGFESPAPAD